MRPIELIVMPLPRPDTTPPVTIMYFITEKFYQPLGLLTNTLPIFARMKFQGGMLGIQISKKSNKLSQ
jgi:hypothetical protein